MPPEGLKDGHILLGYAYGIFAFVSFRDLPGEQGREVGIDRLPPPLEACGHADAVAYRELTGPVVQPEQAVPPGDEYLAAIIQAHPPPLLADMLPVEPRYRSGAHHLRRPRPPERVGHERLGRNRPVVFSVTP